MLQKRTFKVLAAIPKRDGGHFWMRCGNGYTNKDDSINVYLDVLPKDMKFQLRELDEEDLRRRDGSTRSSLTLTTPLAMNGALAPIEPASVEDPPF